MIMQSDIYLVFIAFFLCLVHYCESISCNGKEVNSQSFTIQPILIWNIESTQTSSFLTNFQRDFLALVNGKSGEDLELKRLFQRESENSTGAVGGASGHNSDGRMSQGPPEWAERLMHWERQYYNKMVAPFLKNPPKVLEVSSITVSPSMNSSALLALGKEGRKAGNNNDQVMYSVPWPVMITNKGPVETINGLELNFASALAGVYPAVSVLMLNNVEASDDWQQTQNERRAEIGSTNGNTNDDSSLPQSSLSNPATDSGASTVAMSTADSDLTQPGRLRVFNLPVVSDFNSKVEEIPVLKEFLAEVYDVLCLSFAAYSEDSEELKLEESEQVDGDGNKVKYGSGFTTTETITVCVGVGIVAIAFGVFFLKERFCDHGLTDKKGDGDKKDEKVDGGKKDVEGGRGEKDVEGGRGEKDKEGDRSTVKEKKSDRSINMHEEMDWHKEGTKNIDNEGKPGEEGRKNPKGP